MNMQMKIINDDLTIIVNKRHVKTDKDKEVLSKAISAICHLDCYDPMLTIEEITEILSNNKGIYIAFTSIAGDFCVSTSIKGNLIIVEDYYDKE